MSGPEDFTIGGFEIVDPDEPAPEGRRPPAMSPYAVPLSTLVAGAYVGAADRTEVHPEPLPPGSADLSVPLGPDGAGGFDGGGSE